VGRLLVPAAAGAAIAVPAAHGSSPEGPVLQQYEVAVHPVAATWLEVLSAG
jgi:hypothetical protein